MRTYNPIKLIILVSIVLTGFSGIRAQEANRFLLQERIEDAYLPPGEMQHQRTPGYRYDTSLYFTVQVNVDANGDNIVGDAANEPSIAVDPTDPERIVIGWRQFDNVNSSFRQAGYGYSNDGGHTWTFPGVIDPGQFRSDPVLDYDAEGNFYYNSLGVSNNGADMWCDVFRITDNGFEWDEGAYANGGDKQWMRIDRTEGMGVGNIYAAWNYTFTNCNGDFTRSTDGGESYEDCIVVQGHPYWATLAVGPDGELYEAGGGNYPDGILVVKSNNANMAGSTISWDMETLVFLDGKLKGGSDINPVGLLGQAWVDVDRSDGPGRGNVYVCAAMERLSHYDQGDVMFRRSTDGGLTWEDPIRINDDVSFSNYQWMATMSVAPDGRIDVVWLDTRDAPSNYPHYSALYYAYSIDHGESFSPNQKISELFNPHVGYPVQQKMGDYFDMVSDLNGAHLAWANTLNGEEDVYYTHITPSPVLELHENGTAGASFNLHCFPNPFKENTKISFYIPDTEHVILSVFDAYGKKIAEPVNKTMKKGSHRITLKSGNYTAGVYHVRLQAGEQTQLIKIVATQ